MTEYKFYRNKKITNCMILNVILGIVIIVLIPFMIREAYAVLNTADINEVFINLITNIVIIFTITLSLSLCILELCIIIYHSMARYRIDGTSITTGILLKKTIDCREVTKVRCKKDFMNFITPKKTLTFSLTMLKCDKHYAQSLLSFIKENLSKDVLTDNRSSELLDGAPINLSYEKPNPKIGGWVLLLFISIIFSIFTYLNRLLPNSLTSLFDSHYIFSLIIGLGMLAFIIVVIVAIAQKKELAKVLIKVFLWCNLACSIEGIVSLYIVQGISVINVLISLSGILGGIFYNLGILEYIKTSVRVKNTFVN